METGRRVAEERQGVTSATGNIADFRPEETPGGETWEEVMGSITSPVDAAASHNAHTYTCSGSNSGAEKKIRAGSCRSLHVSPE